MTKRTIHFHILLLFVNFICLLWYYFWQCNCPRPSSVHPHPMLSPDWLKQQLSPKQHCGQWEQVKNEAREEPSSVTFNLVLVHRRIGKDSWSTCAANHNLLVVETLFLVTHSTAGATDVITWLGKKSSNIVIISSVFNSHKNVKIHILIDQLIFKRSCFRLEKQNTDL